MLIFGLIERNISEYGRYIENLIETSFEDDLDTKVKVLRWLLTSTEPTTESSNFCDTDACQVLSVRAVFN